MVWKIQLVDVNGRAVAKQIWTSEDDAPRTLQEACLVQENKGSMRNSLPQVKERFEHGRTAKIEADLPTPAVFNPVTVDFSYMRYAACLGAGGDVCGWSDADRLPDLVYSRESSPSTSSSSDSIASPSSSIGFWSRPPSINITSPHGTSSHSMNHPRLDHDIDMVPLGLCARNNDQPPEMELSYMLAELQESFVNPFTHQEFYEEV